VEVAGEADNGHAAVSAIQKIKPDLVFLDVQMPGMTGIEVARQIGADHMPITIFVTAYDRYAMNAFELAALDYLLKPFDDERFEQAVQRARQLHALKHSGEIAVQMRKTLELLDSERGMAVPTKSGNGFLERIAIESRGQVRMVLAEEIDYITASGVYAELHVADRTHVVRERMQALEERLNPRQFFRVHRSIIVQLNRIEVLLRQTGGDYSLRLKNGAQLPVSRNRIDQLEQWMGVPGTARP
jgi:two-component system LytT family response regulator